MVSYNGVLEKEDKIEINYSWLLYLTLNATLSEYVEQQQIDETAHMQQRSWKFEK